MSLKSATFLKSLERKRFTFGTLLVYMRQTLGISQVEVADKMNVSKGLVCDIEKGRRSASIKFVLRLASIIGAPKEVLLQQAFRDQLKKHRLNFVVRISKKIINSKNKAGSWKPLKTLRKWCEPFQTGPNPGFFFGILQLSLKTPKGLRR